MTKVKITRVTEGRVSVLLQLNPRLIGRVNQVAFCVKTNRSEFLREAIEFFLENTYNPTELRDKVK